MLATDPHTIAPPQSGVEQKVEPHSLPLSGLRQSFLDGSLTRLLDPDKVLRAKVVESVESGEFGLASGSLPNGKYQRVWFREVVQPEEVTFDPNVFLIKKEKAEALTAPPTCGRRAGNRTAGGDNSRHRRSQSRWHRSGRRAGYPLER
jgi:hypothetical protein